MSEVEVLLINANFHPAWNPAPAPGLGYLAAILEKNGINVRVLDPPADKLSLQDVVETAEAWGPRIIGLSCLTSYRFDAFELAEALKARRHDWKIVVGGPHVTFLDEAVLRRVPAVDCVVRGEGEFALLEYLACDDPAAVCGLTYRDNGSIVRTPDRKPIENLDSLPFPAYHLFPDFAKYDELGDIPAEWRGIRHAPIVSSRGCPHGCIFCSSANFWRSRPAFRARSAENIADEMEHLQTNFNVQYIRFFDDNFTADKGRVLAVCDEILRRKLRLRWRAEARIDGVDQEMLEKMAAAGCHEIEYGIETGSPKVMAEIGKNVELDRVPEVVRMTRKAGLRPKAFFIVGLPGEEKEDFLASLRLSRSFDYVAAFPLLVFPGSPLCRRMERNGDVNEETWFVRKVHNPFKGFEEVPLGSGAHSIDALRQYTDLLNGYSHLRRRLGVGLRLANLPHPRRMVYLTRSIAREYRELAGLAVKSQVKLPFPSPSKCREL